MVAAQTVVELFERQCDAVPDAPALILPDSTVVSYARLHQMTGQVAAGLRRLGVTHGEPVGLYASRSPDAVVLMLGILRAGGHYVPLSPDDPPTRISHIVDHTGLRTVVRTNSTPRLDRDGLTQTTVDELAAPPPQPSPDPAMTPDEPAYLMYTSGSTGRPKGVVCTHKAVANLAGAMDIIGLRPSDRVLQFAPLGFDAATFEILVPLCTGASVAVAPEEVRDLPDLVEFLRATEVTVVWLTASLCHELAASQLDIPQTVRCVIAGGDVVRPAALRHLATRAPWLSFYNGYGPTECTTFTTIHAVTAAELGNGHTSLPIGRPLPGTHVHVLSGLQHPVPPGSHGELYIGGAGAALGYHRDAAGTAERFLPDPFSDRPGARMYRTGDLVRLRTDGALDFAGRMDRQVKVRGHRVEPGEAEMSLAAHPSVRHAVVRSDPDDVGGARLTGYVVLNEPQHAGSGTELRRWLSDRLPTHLVPSAIFVLPRLPLTSNGKVDLAALPAAQPARPAGPAQTPEGPMYQLIQRTWCSTLGVEVISPGDNFFELGGDSLRMMRMAAELREHTGLPIVLADLLDIETAAELAGHLECLADR